MGDLYILPYFGLAAYHVLDLVCDLHCWYNFEESNSNRSALLTVTCVCTVIIKLWFFFRFCETMVQILQPHIGRIDVAAVLSPELNFNVLEAALNLFQSGQGGEIIFSKMSSRGCVGIMNINFTCCCCSGAVLQFIVFSKNLFYRQGGNDENIIGFVLSLLSLLVGLPSILVAQSC